MKNNTFVALVIVAVLLKLSLCLFVLVKAPDAIIQNDSRRYLECSKTIVEKQAFGRTKDDGRVSYELLRTPGYPFFLAVLRLIFGGNLKPVIFIQVLLTIFSAFFVYNASKLIDPKISKLSTLIVLFDPASTVYSMMILTEALFLFIISSFLFFFVKYFNSLKLRYLMLSAVALACSVYVRPVSYYLAPVLLVPIVLFCLRAGVKRTVLHVLLFAILYSSLIGLWHYRNIHIFHKNAFSSISSITVGMKGLIGSYERNEDMYTQDMSPAPYYVNVATRCTMSLMTRPASFKYFHYDKLKLAGKIFAYPWMIFWVFGFLIGLVNMKDNRYVPVLFLIVFYFMLVTVLGTMWGSGPRFRIPMVPFIAVISSYGWNIIINIISKNNNKSSSVV